MNLNTSTSPNGSGSLRAAGVQNPKSTKQIRQTNEVALGPTNDPYGLMLAPSNLHSQQ
jgi:hypothetical protein